MGFYFSYPHVAHLPALWGYPDLSSLFCPLSQFCPQTPPQFLPLSPTSCISMPRPAWDYPIGMQVSVPSLWLTFELWEAAGCSSTFHPAVGWTRSPFLKTQWFCKNSPQFHRNHTHTLQMGHGKVKERQPLSPSLMNKQLETCINSSRSAFFLLVSSCFIGGEGRGTQYGLPPPISPSLWGMKPTGRDCYV